MVRTPEFAQWQNDNTQADDEGNRIQCPVHPASISSRVPQAVCNHNCPTYAVYERRGRPARLADRPGQKTEEYQEYMLRGAFATRSGLGKRTGTVSCDGWICLLATLTRTAAARATWYNGLLGCITLFVF